MEKPCDIYLFKQLNPVGTGSPTCLTAVVATANLMKENKQGSSGSRRPYTHSTVPHGMVEALLLRAPELWVSTDCVM